MDEDEDQDEDEKVRVPEETDPLQKIIGLQTFEGFWDFDAPLLPAQGARGTAFENVGYYPRSNFPGREDGQGEGSMGNGKVAEKAKQWLAGTSVEDGKVIQGWWEWAGKLVQGGEQAA